MMNGKVFLIYDKLVNWQEIKNGLEKYGCFTVITGLHYQKGNFSAVITGSVCKVQGIQDTSNVILISKNRECKHCSSVYMDKIDKEFFKRLISQIRHVSRGECAGKALKPGIDKRMIVIGASTGGIQATSQLLTGLDEDRDIPPILITQHMIGSYLRLYAENLDNVCRLRAVYAQSGQILEQNTIYLAPGERHMRVVKYGAGYSIQCFERKKGELYCPSIDVLFESAACAAGRNAIGVILTGMGEDGVQGLKMIRDKGGFTIGQSEDGCCVYGMPKRAYEIGAVMVQAKPECIAGEIGNYLFG